MEEETVIECPIQSCPICGSSDIKKERSTWMIQEPHGSKEQFTFTSLACSGCGESVADDSYEPAMLAAMNKSKKTSAINMTGFFFENDYNKSNLERIFGLERGSIDKYLQEDVIEPSFLMLLLTYRSFFPYLILEADKTRDRGGFNRCVSFGEIK